MTCEAKQLSSQLINCIKCIREQHCTDPSIYRLTDDIALTPASTGLPTSLHWYYVRWLKSVHLHPNCHSNLASGRCFRLQSLETILGLLSLLPIYPGRQLSGAHGLTDSWDIVRPKLWLPELSLLSRSLGFTQLPHSQCSNASDLPQPSRYILTKHPSLPAVKMCLLHTTTLWVPFHVISD